MKIMNWHKTRLLVTANLVLMSILFPGCLGTQETAIPSLTLTLPPVLATATQLPTEKPSPSPTPSPAEKPVPLSGDVLSKCVEIMQLPLSQLQGTLVLQHIITFDLKEILFLDMETYKEHFISKPGGEYYSNETISPIGTFFAAETFSFLEGDYPEKYQGPIVIFDSSGNLVAEMPLTISSYEFTWLNEEQMLMNYPYEDDNPVTLISPFTNTQKKIKPFMTKIFYPSETFFDWGFYHLNKNVYDPQLTRMLYPSSDDDGPNVTLRDIEQGIDLASFSANYYGWGNWPTWSVDGEKLAIALNTEPFSSSVNKREVRFEIFVINRNGEKLLTTNLASAAKTVYINKLSWSPNGRHIAFWYKDEAKHFDINLQLAVFDTKTQTITRYCINNGDDYIRSRPIWSPNNDYLLLAYRPSKDEKALSSLLLDISDGKAWIIKPEFEPLGWLK